MAFAGRRQGRLSLIVLLPAAIAIAAGTIRTLPHLFPGQVAVSVLAGAAVLLAGSLRLVTLVARDRGAAEALFFTPALARSRAWDAKVPSFVHGAAFRWGIFALLLGVAGFAGLLLASDVWALTRLGSFIPPNAPALVLG